jgi:hypothetical protein
MVAAAATGRGPPPDDLALATHAAASAGGLHPRDDPALAKVVVITGAFTERGCAQGTG